MICPPDQWTPITPSPGEQETGRRDGARGKDENAWANIGPRKYQIEYPAWGLDASEHPWKRLTYFYVYVSEPGTVEEQTVFGTVVEAEGEPIFEGEGYAAEKW